MISKIIQKEKERQEEIPKDIIKKYIGTSEQLTKFDKMLKEIYEEGKLYPASYIIEMFKGAYQDSCENIRAAAEETAREEKKQSLINLKEYMEEEFDGLCNYFGDEEHAREEELMSEKLDRLKEDIEELNKMIERYK